MSNNFYIGSSSLEGTLPRSGKKSDSPELCQSMSKSNYQRATNLMKKTDPKGDDENQRVSR